MSTDLAMACVIVNSSKQDSASNETLTFHNQNNVTNISPTANTGIYEIEFADIFSDYPAVTVTHHFNGGPSGSLNSITENVGSSGGYPSDNAVAVFVAQTTAGNYYCHVKLGGEKSGMWRSFSLIAVGAPKS